MKKIELFDSYFNKITLDITQYNKDHNIEYPNVQPKQFELSNLYNLYQVDLEDFDEILEEYTLDDNDRIDLLAKRLYDDENLWWVILFINQITYYDLPVNDQKLYEMASELYEYEYKYNSIEVYYNLLKEVNQEKRNIKIVKKDYLYLMLRQIYEVVK